MKTTSVVIIGAGIAGITAAIYLKRANKDIILLDSNMPGGKLATIAKIENYPGFSSVSGPELAISLSKQLKDNDIELTYGMVQSIRRENKKFIVTTDIENIETDIVVIGTGTSPKVSGIPGEKEFFGRGVSYCATCDANFFKGKTVAVYGSSDIAFEEALYLSNVVKDVVMILGNKNMLTNESLLVSAKSKSNISFVHDDLVKISGEDFVTSVTLRGGNSLEVSAVFPYLGFKSATDFLVGLGLKMDKGYIITDAQMATNIAGIYAIGDVRKKDLRQLVTAANDGAIASLAINKVLVNK